MQFSSKNGPKRASYIGRTCMWSMTLAVGASIALPVAADVNVDGVSTKKVDKTYTTQAGHTVDVKKTRQSDGEGNARGVRGYQVTDADGEVVARGMDRGRKNSEGAVHRAKKRELTDAEGNTYQKRARAQKDGQGSARAHRQGRKVSADGDVTARARWQDSRGKRKTRVRGQRG